MSLISFIRRFGASNAKLPNTLRFEGYVSLQRHLLIEGTPIGGHKPSNRSVFGSFAFEALNRRRAFDYKVSNSLCTEDGMVGRTIIWFKNQPIYGCPASLRQPYSHAVVLWVPAGGCARCMVHACMRSVAVAAQFSFLNCLAPSGSTHKLPPQPS